jgi:hypothetical protein
MPWLDIKGGFLVANFSELRACEVHLAPSPHPDRARTAGDDEITPLSRIQDPANGLPRILIPGNSV